MKDKWIDAEEYWLLKMWEAVRIPKKYFGEGDKQIQNEKLWIKLRKKI